MSRARHWPIILLDGPAEGKCPIDYRGSPDNSDNILLEKIMAEEATLETKIKECLDELRPMLQRDGGDMELVEIDGKLVKLRLQGACRGCPGARMTLKNGVEARLKATVADEIEVVAVE